MIYFYFYFIFMLLDFCNTSFFFTSTFLFLYTCCYAPIYRSKFLVINLILILILILLLMLNQAVAHLMAQSVFLVNNNFLIIKKIYIKLINPAMDTWVAVETEEVYVSGISGFLKGVKTFCMNIILIGFRFNIGFTP